MAESLQTMADRGLLSALGAHVLQATVAAGRNVLFTGPSAACLPPMTALVAESTAPGIYSAALHAGVQDASAFTAEPSAMAAWHLPPKQLVAAMGEYTGVVGHIRAGRLDRALMRFEIAAGGGSSAALHVLASVDVVVVVQHILGHPQVTEVCEVRMAKEGYRPVPLFATGIEPMVDALVPCGVPSFVSELMLVHPGPWWAELQAAAKPQPGANSFHAADDEPQPEPPAPLRTAVPKRKARPGPGTASIPKTTTVPPHGVLGSLPGWELDRLPPELPSQPLEADTDFAAALAHQATLPMDLNEDDDLAATYGLEPPPRPKS
jgi:hypothetical protein